MNPVNTVLSFFGVRLSRVNGNAALRDDKEKEFRKKFEQDLRYVEKNEQRGFKVYREYRYDIEKSGENHQKSQVNYECEFMASHLYKVKPSKILDIGSFRHFILGLLAHYDITSVDIRKRTTIFENETLIHCDAKSLNLPDNSFDAVVTMGTLPHIGLGRYRDDLDLDADIKAFNEMIRVLKPGGIILFSTAVKGGQPVLAFNARRNYSYDMIKDLCKELELVEEKFFDRRTLRWCTFEELTTDPTFFDYYVGCWRKRNK